MREKEGLVGFYEMLLGVILGLSFVRQTWGTGEGKYGYFSADRNSEALLQRAVWNVVDSGNLTQFSFLTCSDGELLYQTGTSGDMLKLLLNNGTLEFHWAINVYRGNIALGNNLNNNRWYTLNTLRYLGNLYLNITQSGRRLFSTSVANSTFRTYFSSIDLTGSVGVYVGRGYTGCLMEGPSVIFKDNSNGIQSTNVTWSNSSCTTSCSIDNGNVNACLNYPCQRGTCQEVQDGFRCDCPHLFNGTRCEVDLSQYGCAVDPCLHGGNCSSQTSQGVDNRNYQCTCAPGYTGVNCEFEIQECGYKPCQNGAECIDKIDAYECNCTETGYTGVNCDVDIDECNTTDICGANVRCFNNPGSYTCGCPAGFIGTDCQDINECQSNPCQHGGTCNNQVNKFTCDCVAGYTGTVCETDIDDCLGVTCPGTHSECQDGVNTYSCVCKPGYRGNPGSCVDIDECSSNPCRRGATCNNLVNAYSCDCEPGYTGTNCDVEINECIPNPCDNGATCTDQLNGYKCTCAPGYTGDQCQTNIDDCALTSRPCFNGGTCVDGVDGYTCNCAPGYTGDRCGTDIDECAINPCGPYSTSCKQGVNSFTCTCKPGYTGDRCETDIDECAPGPCKNGGTCQNLVNRYNCLCPQVWMGPTCQLPYNACDASLENCKNGATCSTEIPAQDFNCTCLSGFTGTQCETNIDDCTDSSCTLPLVCYDEVNDFRCACPIGYEGADCSQEIDECDSSPCQNGGTCQDNIGNYTCNCEYAVDTVPGTNQTFETGYTGINCEIDIDECDNSPSICLHGGSCKNEPGTFQCLCGHDSQGTYFTGSHCKETTSYCYIADDVKTDQPACKNNGTCFGLDGDYRCECAAGFTGRRCRVNIDECESNPCQYNGTCIDGIASYTCDCIPGITGLNCEINIDDCTPDPCLNDGICIDGINSYDCNCTDTGFKDVNCSVNIDDCEPAPCNHGATCRDGIKEYFCDCYAGYTGSDCETDINECLSNPCAYNSTCLQRSNENLYDIDEPFDSQNFTYATAAGYQCDCVAGSTGANCETNINDCVEDGTNIVLHNCSYGTCFDLLDNYRCDCFPGYTGRFCDIEIDECEPGPCQNGATCTDKVADYDCSCVPYDQVAVAYAGKNCTFQLTSCQNNECHNGATCRPYLVNEARREQDYDCLCTEGFSGRFCNLSTTVSLDNSSISSQLQPDDLKNLEISFKFRTTLTDVVLVSWTGAHITGLFLSLELKNGNLMLQYHLDAKDTMATAAIRGVTFNDGNWQKVKLTKATGLLVEVTSPRCASAADCTISVVYNSTIAPFETLTFGNVGTSLLSHTLSGSPYVGCMEDVTVQGTRLTPAESYLRHSFSGVSPGCPRVDQCLQMTCNQKGACVDLWNKFRCDCYRPNLGMQCETSYVAATFAFGNTDSSFAAFTLDQQPTDISFFFRSRKQSGLIMIAGRTDSSYITVELYGGRVGMRYKLCGAQETFHVTSHNNYADGNQQLVQVVKNGTSLTLSVNESSESVTIANGCSFSPGEIIFGGRTSSSASGRRRREIITAPLTLASVGNFKGTIQDARVNDVSLQFFPLTDPSFSSLRLLDAVAKSELKDGEVTDPVCNMTSPCENNSTCEDAFFNDYKCHCLLGYRGKNCSELDFCVTGTCPDGSHCQSLLDGFECISTATFNGESTYSTYTRPFPDTSNINTMSVKFRTVAYNGKQLLTVAKDSASFYEVGIEGRRVVVVYKVSGSEELRLAADHDVADSVWYRADIQEEASQLTLGLYDTEQEREVTTATISRPSGGATLADMLSSSSTSIMLGSRTGDARSPSYQGCLTEARIGGILLPFFNDNLFVNNTSTRKFVLDSETNLSHGCVAGRGCYASACVARTTAACEASYYSQVCTCKTGYTGAWCQERVDYCDVDGCTHGQCVNRLDGAYCRCPAGYKGTRCEEDVNECADNVTLCQNNGSCQNDNGTFTCNCAVGFTGQYCEKSLTEDCSNDPCIHGTCENVTIGASQTFNCTCEAGYEGALCDQAIDYCEDFPCLNGGNCTSHTDTQTNSCSCPDGFSGNNCEVNIDDCPDNACENNGTCVDGITSYTCNCSNSIYFEGPTCELDIDECKRNQPCQNNALCLNHIGQGFTCDCTDTGYQGIYCSEDVDECQAVPAICKNGAECTNTVGSYDCNCTRGYTDLTCATVNCSDVPCKNGAQCMVTPSNTWMCDCPQYYEGEFCGTKGPCADGPCHADNTRSCTQNVTSNKYTCNCKTGWIGQNCTEDFDECSSNDTNSCQNGATCVNTDGSYSCTCVPGYTGNFCQTNIDECGNKPCENGGYCIDGIGEFTCNCSGTGFDNLTCSQDVDECLSSPCLYGGTCVNTLGSYTCNCAEDYEGQDCSVKAEKSMEDSIIWYIVGPCVALVLILIVIGVIWFLMCVRKRRATRGDYSPSRQEVTGSRVELGNVLKKPPLERLI